MKKTIFLFSVLLLFQQICIAYNPYYDTNLQQISNNLDRMERQQWRNQQLQMQQQQMWQQQQFNNQMLNMQRQQMQQMNRYNLMPSGPGFIRF